MEHLPDRRLLSSRVAELIREAIRHGEWKGTLPGQRALAERFHVSRPTLAEALAQLRREKFIRVFTGRRSLITASPAGKARGRKPPRIIRVVSVQPFENLSYLSLYSFCELERRLAEEGYRLEIHSEPGLRRARPFNMLERLAHAPPAACWILHGARSEVQEWFARRELPVVLTSMAEEKLGLPFVDFDYGAMARHAAGVFLQLGHFRVGLLTSDRAKPGEQRLEHTLRRELESRCPGTAGLFTFEHNGSAAGIGHAISRVRGMATPVSALLVAGTSGALLALSHLARAGTRVPRDLSVVCSMEDPLIQCHVPEVTRYRTSMKKFARALQRLTLDVAAGGTPRRHVLLVPEFFKGETLAPPPPA